MKAIAIPLVVLALCLDTPNIFAQQKEDNREEQTIIVRKKEGTPQTIIEIKDGDILVNGEKVASADESRSYKKIIVDDDNDARERELNAPIGRSLFRKAILGVITRPDNTDGAVIEHISPNSAARDAGLKAGDIITKIDDKSISNSRELVETIGEYAAGDKVIVTYKRGGEIRETEATLTGMTPPDFPHRFNDDPIPNALIPPFIFDDFASAPKLGVLAEDAGNGVRIVEVKPNSLAEKTGLQKDDIIRKLDDENIHSVNELQNELRRARNNEKIALEYERNGKTSIAEISLPKQKKRRDL